MTKKSKNEQSDIRKLKAGDRSLPLKTAPHGLYHCADPDYPDVTAIVLDLHAADHALATCVIENSFRDKPIEVVEKEVRVMNSGILCGITMKDDLVGKVKTLGFSVMFNGATFGDITRQMHDYLAELDRRLTAASVTP